MKILKISSPMRKVTPISKQTEIDKKDPTFFSLFLGFGIGVKEMEKIFFFINIS